MKYLNAEGRAAFERPYGLAWLLQLAAELKEWDDPQARQWSATLRAAGTGRDRAHIRRGCPSSTTPSASASTTTRRSAWA